MEVPRKCACAAFDPAGCKGAVYVVACTSPSSRALLAAVESHSADSLSDEPAGSGFLCKLHRDVYWRGLFGVVKGEQQGVAETAEATQARLDFLYAGLSIPTANLSFALRNVWKYYNDVGRSTEFDIIHHKTGQVIFSQLALGKNIFDFPIDMMTPHFYDMPRDSVFHAFVNFHQMKTPILAELTMAQHFAFYPEWRAWSRKHCNGSLCTEFTDLCRSNNWDITTSLKMQTTIYCKINQTSTVPVHIECMMNEDVVITMIQISASEGETEADLTEMFGMSKYEPACGAQPSENFPPLSGAIFA